MFVNNGFIFVGLTVFDPLILQKLGASVGALKTRDAVTLISAALLSPLSGYMLDRIGVRPIMATGMLFMAIGMFVYAGAASVPDCTSAMTGISYYDALRTRSFWLLASIAMVTFFAELGIVTNLVLYVEKQLGQPAELACRAVFVTSTASVLFKLLSGPLIDRVGAKRVHLAGILTMGVGLAALAWLPPGYLFLSVGALGIGWGANYAAIQFTTSTVFSGNAIGRILGTINIIEATGAGLGPAGFGRLYDLTHTYAVPFGISAVLVLLMSIAVAQVPVPKG